MESCNHEAKANEENSSMLVSSTHLPPTKYSDNGERLRDFCGECSDPFYELISNETVCFKNANNCWNINNIFYSEASGVQCIL
jgi:hypothetical protein